MASQCAIFALQHDESSALTQIETGSCGVERPATLLVEYHERLETIEMEAAKTLATSNDNDVAQTAFNHSSTHNDGIEGCAAGRRNGCCQIETTEIVGNGIGRCPTVVSI